MTREDSNERTRRLWDRYAPRYDRQIARSERLLFPGGRAWACSQASGDALEVAVGTGLNLPCYPAGITLTGIDLSPAMLAIARDRATMLGMAVNLREASADVLPFPRCQLRHGPVHRLVVQHPRRPGRDHRDVPGAAARRAG